MDGLIYLSGLASGDAPFGSGRFCRDDDVALDSDGRQGDDVVEAKETDAECVRVATCHRHHRHRHQNPK